MTRYISMPSRTKEILEQYCLKAKKGFGQNFLVDPVIVEKCASLSHSEGAVIEIGPGIGSLTEQLARFSKHVLAYEIDENLLPVLKDTLAEYENIEIILQDFLTIDLDAVAKGLKEEYGSVSVCANLPYYITTPVLFKIFDCHEIEYITVMVQKEVGERFAAKPGEAAYSALSVEGQYLYDIKKLFTVPGRSFNPSPSVDSVIIQFVRKRIETNPEELKKHFELIRAMFKQRRKTVYNNLREFTNNRELAESVLKEAGIAPGKRAQELTVEELKRICEVLYERSVLRENQPLSGC